MSKDSEQLDLPDFNDPDEAIDWITQNPVFQKIKVFDGDEAKFRCTAHHGLGQWMRNNFGLWKNGKDCTLVRWFWENLHLSHADDMSGILLIMVYRRAKQQDLRMADLKVMAEKSQEYWYKMLIEGREV